MRLHVLMGVNSIMSRLSMPPMQRRAAPKLVILCVLVFVCASALQAAAQVGDHNEHHPGSTTEPPASGVKAPAASSQQPGAGKGGSMGEMGGMREMMARPQKEFYPSLMDISVLMPEQRQKLEAQARARLGAGIDEIANAESALRHAHAAGDVRAAEQAIERMRDGLNLASSGTTALRSLSDGKTPQQIAQEWFKGKLNLTSPTMGPIGGGPGLSWFHITTMSILAAFAAGILGIYLVRMRRANALLVRLTSVPRSPATPPTPARLYATSAAVSASVAPSTTLAAIPHDPATGKANLQAPVPASSPGGAPARGGLWKGQLRVAAIFPEARGVKTFRLRDPQGGPIPFTFVPGQFVTYSADIAGKLVRRSYTISSSAAQTAYIETTIKREEPGIFSDYMHDQIVEGDLVDVMAPSGVFTFTGKEGDSVVLIGGGVGITPLMAAIRYLFDTVWTGEIFLVYGAQTSEHFIFRDELEYLQHRMRNLHVAATMARAVGTAWMGQKGHITKEFLAQSVPEIAKRRVHLCGPPGMMQALRKILAELGVPAEQIKTEAFGPALGAVPPPGATVVRPIGVPLAPPADAAAPSTRSAIGPATATIQFASSNVTAPLPPDRTVLEVSEDVGVNIDYSCRVGICGVCKTELLEGEVTMEVQDALTEEDKRRNTILACQAKSVGNLAVEA